MLTTHSTKTIDQITETLIDYRGKTPPKTTSGVKLITAKVIKGGFVVGDNHEYISEETYQKWMRRGLPRQWDILITTEAPLGEVAQLRTLERVALAQRVILLRGDPQQVDQQFYFQALKSPFVQARLKARATGTTVLGIKQSELRQVEIPWHPLPTQRKIAAVLSAYDDLIENNTRRIQILEAMAQAIYREWFVHFRFPGHEDVPMVETGLGLVPAGWDVGVFSDIAEVLRINIKPLNCKGETFEHFSFPAFDNGCMPILERGKEIRSNKYFVEQCTVLLSKLNPRIPRVWLPFPEPKYRSIASTEFLVLRPKSSFTPVSLFSLCQSQSFLDEFATLVGGTSTSHQRVKPNDFLAMPVLIPPESILNTFTDRATPMLRLVQNLRLENVALRQTRNLLLPRLVSGRVDVSELDIAGENPQRMGKRTNLSEGL